MQVRLYNGDLIDVSRFNLIVEYSNSSHVFVNNEKTAESLLESLKEDFAVSFNTNKIYIGLGNSSFCDGVHITGDVNEVLFTIFYAGTPGESTEFSFFAHGLVNANTPTSWSSCIASIPNECDEIEHSIPSADISGNIESLGQDCDGSYNHGVPDVVMTLSDHDEVPEFDCITQTDSYGDYSCTVAQDRGYRISPTKQDNPGCGLTSVDIDEIRDHILNVHCLTENWQLIAADANESGTISTLDLVEIQKVILQYANNMKSWTFVPSNTYNGFSAPSGCQTSVPSFQAGINITDVTVSMTGKDFVGIKVGDVNGTCTDCSGTSLQAGETIKLASRQSYDGVWEFFSQSDINHLSVYYLEFDLPSMYNSISVINYLHDDHLRYSVIGNKLRVSYFNLITKGEIVKAGKALLGIVVYGRSNNEPILSNDTANEIVAKPKRLYKVEPGNVFESRYSSEGVYGGIQIYPNPVTGSQIYVNIKDKSLEGVEISFYNSLGVCVIQRRLSDETSILATGHLPPGLYSWTIHGATKGLYSGRLIIQR